MQARHIPAAVGGDALISSLFDGLNSYMLESCAGNAHTMHAGKSNAYFKVRLCAFWCCLKCKVCKKVLSIIGGD